jgi:hypothetical protein
VVEPIDGVVMINDLAIEDFVCSGGGANIIELVVGVYHFGFNPLIIIQKRGLVIIPFLFSVCF